MQRWEYLRVTRSREIKDKFIASFTASWNNEIDENELGMIGWELVTIVPYASKSNGTSSVGFTTDEMWVFKRPLK